MLFCLTDEMKRRRDFYAENRELEPGEVVETFNIAEDEIISLSIQFYERSKWVDPLLFSLPLVASAFTIKWLQLKV